MIAAIVEFLFMFASGFRNEFLKDPSSLTVGKRVSGELKHAEE